MSTSPPPRTPTATTATARLSRSAIVGRLRAAGCVFAEDEARLLLEAADTAADLAKLADRRMAGEPLEYLLGWAEFAGLRIAVDPGVFIPRRRTEFLLHQAIARLAPAGPERPIAVDLCCGSGAVAAALAAILEHVEVHAVDVDAAAVRCARRNLGANGQVYEGDLYEPLPPTLRGRVDILVANTPYVPTEAIGLMPSETRVHEPRGALDGGPDGLDVLRRVGTEAPGWLAAGGALLVETSERQAARMVAAFTRYGLVAQVARAEEFDATVVIGTWAARPA